jgi:hypothetical protein
MSSHLALGYQRSLHVSNVSITRQRQKGQQKGDYMTLNREGTPKLGYFLFAHYSLGTIPKLLVSDRIGTIQITIRLKYASSSTSCKGPPDLHPSL